MRCEGVHGRARAQVLLSSLEQKDLRRLRPLSSLVGVPLLNERVDLLSEPLLRTAQSR